MNLLLIVLGLALCLGCAAPAFAQQLWEGKPARILVPYGPGSGPDALARDLADRLSKQTGKTLVVINRPGANGNIGIDAVAKSAPDGFTLLLVDPLNFIVNPLVYGVSPYDWKTELKPVSSIADVSLFLFASTQKRFSTVADLIDFARANPGRLNIGSTGEGSVSHLGGERLGAHTGIQFARIAYREIAQAIPALITGEIDAMVFGPVPFISAVREGKVKPLAVGMPQRSPIYPDVPTLKEAGLPEDLLIGTTFALYAPGGTPDALTSEISRLVARTLADAEMQTKFARIGLTLRASDGALLTAKLRSLEGPVQGLVTKLELRK